MYNLSHGAGNPRDLKRAVEGERLLGDTGRFWVPIARNGLEEQDPTCHLQWALEICMAGT